MRQQRLRHIFTPTNRVPLPSRKFSGKSERLLKIIRDTDKLDIMDLDLVLQSDAQDGFRELPDMLPYIRLSRELTPAALKKFQKKNGLNRQLGYREGLSGDASTWFYDLNYLPSRWLAIQKDLPCRMERELPDNPVVSKLFASIRKVEF